MDKAWIRLMIEEDELELSSGGVFLLDSVDSFF